MNRRAFLTTLRNIAAAVLPFPKSVRRIKNGGPQIVFENRETGAIIIPDGIASFVARGPLAQGQPVYIDTNGSASGVSDGGPPFGDVFHIDQDSGEV